MLQHLTFTLAGHCLYPQEMLLNKLQRKEKKFKNLSAYMPIFHPLKADPEIKI